MQERTFHKHFSRLVLQIVLVNVHLRWSNDQGGLDVAPGILYFHSFYAQGV